MGLFAGFNGDDGGHTMSKISRYLFPPRRIQDRIPLRPLQFSGKHNRAGQVEPSVKTWYLIGHGVARTHADGYRLLEKHAGKRLHHIVKAERRTRKLTPRLVRAAIRFKRMIRRILEVF